MRAGSWGTSGSQGREPSDLVEADELVAQEHIGDAALHHGFDLRQLQTAPQAVRSCNPRARQARGSALSLAARRRRQEKGHLLATDACSPKEIHLKLCNLRALVGLRIAGGGGSALSACGRAAGSSAGGTTFTWGRIATVGYASILLAGQLTDQLDADRKT